MTDNIRIIPLRLHAQCPECGEYRSNTVMTDGKDRIILVCECEHEVEDKELFDAQATHRRDTESLLS